MEREELQRIIEAILFAAGERVEISRLAQTLEVDPKDITEATDALADKLAYDRRGIRILKLNRAIRWYPPEKWRITSQRPWKPGSRPSFLPLSWRR